MRFATQAVKQAILGLVFASATLSSGSAIDLSKETALRFAPEDCDFYVGGMQLQEQWNRFATSQLYKDVANVPFVERAIQAWIEQWENREGQAGQVRQMVDNPNVETLLNLAQDMFSHEMFAFADGQASEMLLRINTLSNEITAIAQGDDPSAILDYFMQIPKSEIDDIPVPTFVMGFKVHNQERVLGKLDELEAVIRFGLGNVPFLQSFVQGLERVEDSRGIRVSWTIIPEMVPWAKIRSSIPSNESNQITDKIQALLEDRQICITIGQLDGYLVIALSEDAEAIADLGKQSSLLKNPDMAPVIQKENEKITGVTFVSDAYADAYYQSQFKDFFSRQASTYYRAFASGFDSLPLGFESIPDDLAWIDEQIGELVPEFQGQSVVSFLTETGSEIWNYSRTENVWLDGSKSLDVLEHVGSDPIVLLAFRLQDHPEYFATVRRIVRKIKEYLDLVPELDSLSSSARDAWEVGLDRGWPLVVKLADILETQFLPSMKDGQHAWVIQGGSLASKQWFKEMPASKSPLPFPEIATITGLSDKKAMSDSWSSLFGLFNSALELVRELEPNSAAASFSIPTPKPDVTSAGERYTVQIPDECPVPKDLTPQVLLTDHFMISSYSDQQTDGLAKSQALNVAKGVVIPGKPCSGVSYLDLGRLVQFVKPWIAYAIETTMGNLDQELVESQPSMPALKGSDVVEIWSALGSAGQFASVTTNGDDGGSVTRTVITQP